MNWQTILGLVLIGVGTYLTFVGARAASQADNKPLESKVEQVLTEIREVRESPASPESRVKLDQIEQDFLAWARGFEQNRTSKKLELDQTRLQVTEHQLELSRIVRPVFVFVVDSLRNALDAYNALGGNPISYELPSLPERVVNRDAKPWQGSVVFGPDVAWEVSVSRQGDMSEAVDLEIAFKRKVGALEVGNHSFDVFVYPGTKSVRTEMFGTRLPKVDGLEVEAALDKYQPELRGAIKRLLEVQILSLKE